MTIPEKKVLLEEIMDSFSTLNAEDSSEGPSDPQSTPGAEDSSDNLFNSDDAFGVATGMICLWELFSPAVAAPISTYTAFESNPELIKDLTASYRSLQANLASLDALLQEQSTTLSPDTRTLGTRNADQIRTAVQTALQKLRELESDVQSKGEDEEMLLFFGASQIKDDCTKLQTDLHRATSLLNEVHTLLAAASAAFRRPRTLAEEAASIADRPVHPPPYPVFVSHAGEDKHTIAIPLWEKLRKRRISSFVDKKELPVGENAPDGMKDAMASAPVGVFILSPEFASSFAELMSNWTGSTTSKLRVDEISLLRANGKARRAQATSGPTALLPICERGTHHGC